MRQKTACILVLFTLLCGCSGRGGDRASVPSVIRGQQPPSPTAGRDQHSSAWGYSEISPSGAYVSSFLQIAPPYGGSIPPHEELPAQAAVIEEVPLLLHDAVNLALQNSEVVQVLDGGIVQTSAATGYDPVILTERWNAARATFDPQLQIGFTGRRIDQPPDAFFGPGIPTDTQRVERDFFAELSKSWETGGTTSIAYAPPLAYLFFPEGVGTFNPLYSSDLVLSARQPLLRGGGVGVNTAPIRITWLRRDQSMWEFKQATIAQVRSVIEAYWRLQASQVTLQSIESVMPLLREAVRLAELRLQAELVTKAELARARLQLSEFDQRRIAAEAEVRRSEWKLRNLLHLPLSDGRRLVPVTPPERFEPKLSHPELLSMAAEYRPDLIRQQLQLSIRQLELDVASNGVKPQVDFRALYRFSGLGENLDDALGQMGSLRFADWTLGISFSMPLGNRAPRANASAAELQLFRDSALYQQSLQNTSFQISEVALDLRATSDQYRLAKSQLEESRKWVEISRVRFKTPPAAGSGQDWLLVALNDYQLAIRTQVDAMNRAAELQAQFNTLLARMDETTGVLLERWQIHFDDDPCRAVQKRGLFPDRAAHAEAASGPVTRTSLRPARVKYIANRDGGWSLPPKW